MNTIRLQQTAASVIIASLVLTAVSCKQASAANEVKDDKIKLITSVGSNFTSVQDSMKKQAESAAKDPEPPAKPKTNADKSSWDDYYKNYMEYINKLTDPAQRARAWGNFAADLLAMSKEKPGNISAATMKLVLSNLTEEYKKTYRGDSGAIKDLSAIAGDIVSAAENIINSGTFFKYDAAAQRSVISNFMALSVEITWRDENNAKNSGMYTQISNVFGKIMEKGSTDTKAHAFSSLMHLFRVSAWDNRAEIKKIMENAVKAAGGIDKLMNEFSKAFDTATGTSKGTLSIALSNMLYHNKVLNISAENVKKVVGQISGYLADINSGKATASDGTKNGILHLVGGYVNQAISGKKQNEAANKTLISNFVAFADKALDSDNAALQATAINILTAVRANALKNSDKDIAASIKKAFDGLTEEQIKKFIEGADAIFAKNARKDRVAWLSSALMNLAKYNIDNKTGKVSEDQVVHMLGQIATWASNASNFKDMRVLSYQRKLFVTLTALTKSIYAKGSDMSKNAKIADSICKIFSAVPGLKDGKVRAEATQMALNLADTLRSRGFTDLADRIDNIFNKDK